MKPLKDESSYSSILSHPTIKKLVTAQVFFGFSGGIGGFLTTFFLIYLDGGNVDLARAHYGLYYMVSNLVFGGALAPSGILLDKIGRKRVLSMGVSLAALSSFMIPLSTIWWQLLFAGAVSSLGGALIQPAMNSIIADVTLGYRREKSYGLMMATNIIPATTGAAALMSYSYLFYGILPDSFYYRFALFVSAILAVIGAIPAFFVKESFKRNVAESTVLGNGKRRDNEKTDRHATASRTEEQTPPYTVPDSMRRNRVVLKIILINGLIGFGAGFIIPIFQFYWFEVFGLSQAFVFFIGILGDAGLAAGALLAPWLAKRVARTGGRVVTIVACQSISIMCAALLSIVPWYQNLWLAIVSYVARQDLMNMISPLTQSMLMDHTPEARRGMVNALTTLAFGAPNAVSPSISSAMITQMPKPFGWAYSFFILITLYTISTWLYFTTRRKDRAMLKMQGR